MFANGACKDRKVNNKRIMKLVKRVEVLRQLAEWLDIGDEKLQELKENAFQHNKWFTEDFVNHRIGTITSNFLNETNLDSWIRHYHIDDNIAPKKVGIIMAGNIPLVGFHDLLCSFVTGHHAVIKLSDKDSVLLTGILEKMVELNPQVSDYIKLAENLKGCDAYMATGSNNSSRYFEYYFGRYPSIIRKNKTSVAILDGLERGDDLNKLADDIFLYFGLGCRNVTQIYVPKDYDFDLLLKSLSRYDFLKDHDKFRNNYDYFLALLIMNDRKYMKNDCMIMVEDGHLFSPVSQLYYAYYDDLKETSESLLNNEFVQCLIGRNHIPFGRSQNTSLSDYADGTDTMQFLLSL